MSSAVAARESDAVGLVEDLIICWSNIYAASLGLALFARVLNIQIKTFVIEYPSSEFVERSQPTQPEHMFAHWEARD